LLPAVDGIFVSNNYDSTMVVGSEVIPVAQFGSSDLFLAKFDSLSGFTGISTLAMPGNQPLTIYANPNNGLCTVDLPSTIHQGSDLVLTIYNAQEPKACTWWSCWMADSGIAELLFSSSFVY